MKPEQEDTLESRVKRLIRSTEEVVGRHNSRHERWKTTLEKDWKPSLPGYPRDRSELHFSDEPF